MGLVEVREGDGEGGALWHVGGPLARRHVQHPRLEALEPRLLQAVAPVRLVPPANIRNSVKFN
jgi:hypothetical protein